MLDMCMGMDIALYKEFLQKFSFHFYTPYEINIFSIFQVKFKVKKNYKINPANKWQRWDWNPGCLFRKILCCFSCILLPSPCQFLESTWPYICTLFALWLASFLRDQKLASKIRKKNKWDCWLCTVSYFSVSYALTVGYLVNISWPVSHTRKFWRQ